MCLSQGKVYDLWYTSRTRLVCALMCLPHGVVFYLCYTSSTRLFLRANVSSTMVGLWSVVWFKYVSFVCALMCLPHGLVCDLWYNSSTCLLSVR